MLGITVKLIRYTDDAPKLVTLASKTSLKSGYSGLGDTT
jgi:hypothetical protein